GRERRAPLTKALALRADLDRNLARHDREDAVGTRVGDRAVPVGAVEAQELRPQLLRLEHGTVYRRLFGELHELSEVPGLHVARLGARTDLEGSRTMPKLSYQSASPARVRADVLVLPMFEGPEAGPGVKETSAALGTDLLELYKSNRLRGKLGDALNVPTLGGIPAEAVVLVGL